MAQRWECDPAANHKRLNQSKHDNTHIRASPPSEVNQEVDDGETWEAVRQHLQNELVHAENRRKKGEPGDRSSFFKTYRYYGKPE
jgi:hypothetical protein